MPVLGTAGHVDHGKSTLVLALTGRDPDRWEQEKQRGLTIDLGFAWTVLPDGREVSFVDVPGHERYLKNMLAGIEAIDAALLVVAADEGWMPQTEEHLAVLDLLDIQAGVVAVTKVDLVDDDLLELALEEIRDNLAGTSLANAALIPVSAQSGDGLMDIVEAIAESIPSESPDRDRPRLWVDRAFSISGAGTIVTGTLLGGQLRVDEQVMLYPAGVTARIRGIQSHEKSHDAVTPGRRIALNLAGVDAGELNRGDVVGRVGEWDLTNRFTVRFRTARYVDELAGKGAYQIHVGSAAVGMKVVAINDDHALIQTDRRLPLASGDRFIVRDTGRRLVVAGGQVLDPAPGPTSRSLQESRSVDPNAGNAADQLLRIRGVDQVDRLRAHSGGTTPDEGIVVGDTVLRPEVLVNLESRITERVERLHVEHPLRPGVPLASLSSLLGVEAAVIEHVVAGSPKLQRIGPNVASADHQPVLTDSQKEQWEETVRLMTDTKLAVPKPSELPADQELIHFKLRQGELIAVDEQLFFLSEQISRIRQILAAMPGEFTVADFRDASGLSRRYAVPILEWADREGLTVRRGDYRSTR